MLAQKSLRNVAIKRPVEAGEGYQDVYQLIQATIQPLTGAMAAQMYGQRLGETRLLLTLPDVDLEAGMGVCVDVPVDAWPDWRVVYVARWSKHAVAHIQCIPLWEREKRED